MRGVLLHGALWVALMGGCTPSTPASEPATPKAKPAPEAPAASAEPDDEPAEPPGPPELHLEVLEERLALGLSIQNHAVEPQHLSSTLRLSGEPRSVELRLSDERDCLTLRPGGEWLWPADWGTTLAPDQEALAELEGSFRFEVRGCEGGVPLRSSEVRLPLRYR